MHLPRENDDFPLWLLLATKQALLRVVEDPELDDARAILNKIDEALEKRTTSAKSTTSFEDGE